jgi:hypothetical protein
MIAWLLLAPEFEVFGFFIQKKDTGDELGPSSHQPLPALILEEQACLSLALLLLPKETVFSYTTKRPMPLFRTGG